MAAALEISAVRRLAAILVADVAGYSRLMGRNEEGTLERLMAHRRALVDPKIAEHHGRIVKTTGDGLLVEFPSVVDGVRCAVEMQRGMAERNSGVPIGERLEFRVGINLSDVIVEGDDIYGDGVNVAARVEALADAGGVFVSNAVYDHVRDRLPFVFEDLGEQQVKNIARPVRVYRIPITENAPAKAPLRAPDNPSLAVLPFKNMRGGPELISVAAQTLRSPRSWPSGSATAAFCSSWQEHTMAEAPATVIVVDDDPSVREALGNLLRSVGLQSNLHGSVPEFLKAGRLDGPTCLALDVRLPGQSGLDFQRDLSAANIRVPIIFITGYGDIPMSVQAIKGGAIEFLTKPFRDQDLLDAIQQGLARDRASRENEKAIGDHQARDLLAAPSEAAVEAGRDRAILSSLLYHALRREELCGLKVRDVRHARRGVTHRDNSGEGEKTRYLPLRPATAAPFAEVTEAMEQRDRYRSRVTEIHNS